METTLKCPINSIDITWLLHYLRFFQVSSNKIAHLLSTISDSFHSMQHCMNTQVNQRLHSLCAPLLPCGRSQQPYLLSSLYNIYVNLNKPTILYHVVSQISTSCIVIIFYRFMSLLVWNLLIISKPYILCYSKHKLQHSCLKNKVFSWGKCWHQFIEQYNTTFTLHTNVFDNNFLILETKPLEWYALAFPLMKRVLLLFHTNYSLFINIRYMAFIVWYEKLF